MKRISLIACLLVATLTNANSAEPATAEAQQLLAAVKEVQTQQAAISANQTRLEEKLAAVAEAVRVARIYSSRSGH